ncbi:hypothetical protein DCG74_13435 [Bradyrhizobium sp. WBAH42]|nr:hypothetical protein DAA53_14170 [Bradyrhizobium sp. WBAH23]UUO28216.1 hypothetical protein DCG74_13435 [Bradyrhizobium sp. WBAH42]
MPTILSISIKVVGTLRFAHPTISLSTSSLRAQRSNPESRRGGGLDCFVARAPRNDAGVN